MYAFILQIGICYGATSVISAAVQSFPLYVGDSEPLHMTYRESDLLSSDRMGTVCYDFVNSHKRELGILEAAPDVIDTMSLNICNTAAAVNINCVILLVLSDIDLV